ncbi:MerR family transcriptional regulator [Gilvimarinus agarilyticus]|uniref:MerR family transcriptional regulator n=1 Tax=Gilvimarinus sp. 2_MG-2023 TaxID=3062666 RepID=UPI001C089AF9|nr:MerR family transcriptional regulator [Gilvimarinus sp. 2_MG-2023]MBU2886008.1 MerR family transcriptional regulator [Gilvimarinus agarilyticus]MDO6570754.1 MerR family transcriptional regulator [Gilvimarinus sp. 2_MG-2023]
MKIGQAAQTTGLSAKSIRYYESLGLVQSERLDNGYRHYSPQCLKELQLVASARQVGFSLEECRSLLMMFNNQECRSIDVKNQVLGKVAQIDQQVQQLTSIRTTLLELAERCIGDESPQCAILQNLTAPQNPMRFTLVEGEQGTENSND